MAKVNLPFKKSAIDKWPGAEVNNSIPFDEKIERLKAQLMEQFEKSRGLKEWVKENLNKI